MSDTQVCPECNRRVFDNGGHHVTCSKAQAPSLVFCEPEPGLLDNRFVSVWDEVTFFNDDREGDRQ